MRSIHEPNIATLDLRLLALFQAILRCRSISEAANQLGIPQPTASRGLARLRDALSDELFVRTVTGMEPTPRALSIVEPVAEMIRLAGLLEGANRDFDPGKATREFVVAGSDVGQWAVLSPLYRALALHPGLTLKTISIAGRDLAGLLEEGRIDIAFGPYPALLANIKAQSLYDEHYACFCRPGHPLVAEPTPERFLTCDHVLTVGRAWAHSHREAEALLKRFLPENRIRVVTESYFAALAGLADTNLVLTAPARALDPVARRLGLASVPPPLTLPSFQVKQYWHLRNDDDRGHRWFRNVIRDALGAQGAPSL